MSSMWKAGDDVIATMRDLIAKYHPHLALLDDEIAVVFREKGSPAGEGVVAGKTATAPALFNLLSDGKKYHFVITLAADVWKDFDDRQRLALLDHHLCACQVKENKETGETKCSVIPPDVAFFRAEIERYGMWRTSGAPPSPALLEEVFGS